MKEKRLAGSRVRYGMTGRAMVVKTGGAQWNDAAEVEFFDELAASCSVRGAAASVGFTTPTVYRQRRLRPEFAAKWKAALDQGYARLELALLHAAADTMEGVEFDDSRPIPRMTVEQAMNVLRAHRHEVEGDGRRGPGRRARVKPFDEVRASILKKVNVIKAARGSEPVGDPAGCREHAGDPGECREHAPSALREGIGEGRAAGDSADCTVPLPAPPGSGRGAEAEGEQEGG